MKSTRFRAAARSALAGRAFVQAHYSLDAFKRRLQQLAEEVICSAGPGPTPAEPAEAVADRTAGQAAACGAPKSH